MHLWRAASSAAAVAVLPQGLTRECPTQEDPLPLFLAQVYAQNHPVMRLNCNSSADFVNGTVQGAQWYTLLGGMQVRVRGGRLQHTAQ